MSLTPTKFTWVSGPGSVKIKGDWDSWEKEIELNKKEDGSFEKEVPLPENKRIHFKYIVDGNWVTKDSDPTVNDDGNVNNTIDVGPAPKAEKVTEGVTAATAGVGAAVAGAGAATVAAAKGKVHEQPQTQTSTSSKTEPAQPIKEVANSDIRSYLPHSLTTATHAAKPVLASTIATVTGADILRGNPEELPVSNAEAQAVQSQATKEPSSVGNAITDATKAETSNAKAGTNAATAGAVNNKLDAPVVPVTDAGHAANVDAARLSAGKEGGAAAGAIASAGISTTQTSSSSANGSAPAASEKAVNAPAPAPANAPAPASSTKASAAAAAPPAAAPPAAANAPAPASSTKASAAAAAPPAAANAPAPASSTKAAAAASAAPAASKASSNGAAPALSPETSGVPAGAIPVSQATNGSSTANADKGLPTAPAQASNGSTIKNGSNTTDNVPTKAPVAPTTPKKAGTVKDKKGTLRGHFKGDSETVGDTSTGSADGSRRKSSFFGKIKHALSPHSSPSK